MSPSDDGEWFAVLEADGAINETRDSRFSRSVLCLRCDRGDDSKCRLMAVRCPSCVPSQSWACPAMKRLGWVPACAGVTASPFQISGKHRVIAALHFFGGHVVDALSAVPAVAERVADDVFLTRPCCRSTAVVWSNGKRCPTAEDRHLVTMLHAVPIALSPKQPAIFESRG